MDGCLASFFKLLTRRVLYFCNYLLWWSFWKLLENVCSLIRIITAPALGTILFDLWDRETAESSTEFVAHVLCINGCVRIAFECYSLFVILCTLSQHEIKYWQTGVTIKTFAIDWISLSLFPFSFSNFLLLLYFHSLNRALEAFIVSSSTLTSNPESLLVFLVGYFA